LSANTALLFVKHVRKLLFCCLYQLFIIGQLSKFQEGEKAARNGDIFTKEILISITNDLINDALVRREVQEGFCNKI
jgi:hypothetical protein